MSENNGTVAIDAVSLLVEVTASVTLGVLETELAAKGFTLGIVMAKAGAETPVGAWLADGAPGSTSLFADPSDHLVAGLRATLTRGDGAIGRALEVRPGPRRAVGPDLTALLVGMHGRCGTIEHAWLRIHRRDAARPALRLPLVDLDPPLSDAESRWVEAIASALRSG